MIIEAIDAAVWLFYTKERWKIMHVETNKIPNKFQPRQTQKNPPCFLMIQMLLAP